MMIKEDYMKVFNWSFETGYKFKLGTEAYPFRLYDARQSSALNIEIFSYAQNFEYNCNGYDQGFKVALTMPGEALTLSKRAIRISLSEDTHIMIKPKLITSATELRSYTPMQRQCFYNSERKLRFFKMYTQNNCEMECLTNFTKIECGCVHFTMPSMLIFQFISLKANLYWV